MSTKAEVEASKLTERIKQAAREFQAAADARSSIHSGLKARPAERVYFIQQGSSGPVKIGSASDPLARLSNLQTGCADTLYLIGHIGGGAMKERELHQRFRHFNIRGEWFEPTSEIFDYIRIATS